MVRETTAEIIARGLQNAEIVQMDAERLDFPDASFDRVLCGFALFFFPQLDRALLEVSRVLKPDGIFAASTFAAQGYPWSWYEALLEAHQLSSRLDHLNGLVAEDLERPKDIEEALKRTGFVHIHIEKQEYEEIKGQALVSKYPRGDKGTGTRFKVPLHQIATATGERQDVAASPSTPPSSSPAW